MKKNIHPSIYLTKIYYNDNLILEISTTKEKLNVNIWSGNHPFYKQSKEILDMEGQIEKFEKKYKILK
jgi:large subunit ribosomal protein L31